MCSGSEAGSYSRLLDFVYHSTLGLRVKNQNKNWLGSCVGGDLFVHVRGVRLLLILPERIERPVLRDPVPAPIKPFSPFFYQPIFTVFTINQFHLTVSGSNVLSFSTLPLRPSTNEREFIDYTTSMITDEDPCP